jgi:hypothetical protein
MKLMKAQHVVPALVVVFLAACSSGPSTSDAKDAVLTELGHCSRVSIKDFEKTNGAETGTNTYQVSVKYLLQINPPDHGTDGQDVYASKMRDVDQRLQQAKQQADALNQWISDAQPRLYGGNDQVRAEYQAVWLKANTANASVKSIETEKAAALQEPYSDFLAECPAINQDILTVIASEAKDGDSANPDKSAYLEGFSVSLTGTLNMIRTDNGWKESL